MEEKKVKHGANLFELIRDNKINIDEVKDFSSNISPYGMSPKALKKTKNNLDKASIYPDPDYVDLKDAIATYCKVNPKNVLIGSGATFFIDSFIKLLSPKKCLILDPSYSEYKTQLDKVGSKVDCFELNEKNGFEIDAKELTGKIIKENIDTVILCNPNNPTGSTLTSNQLKKMQSDTKTRLIIDETYVEFADVNLYSSCKVADENEDIFVMRSTSKFFATPGIRLGYAICSNEDVKDRMSREFSSLWGINIYAEIIGTEMFLDSDFQKDVYDKFCSQREFMAESLLKIEGIEPFETKGNFVLIKITRPDVTAKQLYYAALKENMILRDCSSFENLGEKYFRLCFLDRESNEKMIEFLENFFGDK